MTLIKSCQLFWKELYVRFSLQVLVCLFFFHAFVVSLINHTLIDRWIWCQMWIKKRRQFKLEVYILLIIISFNHEIWLDLFSCSLHFILSYNEALQWSITDKMSVCILLRIYFFTQFLNLYRSNLFCVNQSFYSL